MAKAPDISRSHRFILSFQLEGLCHGLRTCVQYGQTSGKVSLALVKKLREDLLQRVEGPALNGFPDPDESTTAGELLALAEVMNATLKSFLTADEVKAWTETAATWLGLASKAREVIVGK